MSETIRVLKIERPQMGSYYEREIGVAQEEVALQLSEAAPGESVTFTVVEMARAEYEALPEFMGW